MSEPKKASAGQRLPYEAPAITHEEGIESVAVACDPASNPSLPVKSVSGEPNGNPPPFDTCQQGFLNS